MKIQFNGKVIEILNERRLIDFLKERKLSDKYSVIECNNKVLSLKEVKSFILKENDCLEVISFVGGG